MRSAVGGKGLWKSEKTLCDKSGVVNSSEEREVLSLPSFGQNVELDAFPTPPLSVVNGPNLGTR